MGGGLSSILITFLYAHFVFLSFYHCLFTHGDRSTLFFVGEPGVIYWIRLNGFGSSAGEYELSVQVGDNDSTTPALKAGETRDICQTAIEVSLFSDIIGSTADARTESLLTFCGEATSFVSDGVWYKTVGDGSVVTASTCNAGTNFDPQLSVFFGECSTAANVASVARMECVDGGNDPSSSSSSSSCGEQSQVKWSTLPGVTYYIFVDGFLTSSDTFQMSLYPAALAGEAVEVETKEETETGPGKGKKSDKQAKRSRSYSTLP